MHWGHIIKKSIATTAIHEEEAFLIRPRTNDSIPDYHVNVGAQNHEISSWQISEIRMGRRIADREIFFERSYYWT
jgi:hypothetical protein